MNPAPAPVRPVPRPALVLAVLLLLAAALAAVVPARRGGPPDLVLVVWDTCRVDRLSAFGAPRPTTPWLEEFSRGAVRYSGCVAPAPWTAPSHASLFTGLLPSHHGVRVEMGDRVRSGIPLLAETLRDAGYETVGVSANGVVSVATGLDAGFDTFRLSYEADEKPSAARTAAVVREVLGNRAPSRKPLFLFVNFLDAHLPHDPPPEALAALGLAVPPVSGLGAMRRFDTTLAMAHSLRRIEVSPRQEGVLRDLYDADIRFLDAETGALFGWLGERGILDDALVVLTADHGENLGEHDRFGHRLAVDEPLLRVPLVVRWPDGRGAGTVEPRLVSLMDLHPTILGAAGIPGPAGTGRDAVTLAAPPPAGRLVSAEHGPHLPFFAPTRDTFPDVVDRDLEPLRLMFQVAYEGGPAGPEWKLERRVRFRGDGRWSPAGTFLFHLTEDPGETRNLLGGGNHPGIEEIRKRLEGGLEAPRLPD